MNVNFIYLVTILLFHSSFRVSIIQMFLIKFCKPDQNCNLMMDVQRHSLGAGLFKDVLKNVTKYTGKHLCQSRFFNKVAGLRHTSGGCF